MGKKITDKEIMDADNDLRGLPKDWIMNTQHEKVGNWRLDLTIDLNKVTKKPDGTVVVGDEKESIVTLKGEVVTDFLEQLAEALKNGTPIKL